MKKLVMTLAIGMLLFGCAAPGPSHYSKSISISAFDLSRYTEKGFLFTPYKYDGSYQPVAIVSATISPEANLVVIDSISRWRVGSVDPHEALDSLYIKASSMGADAIVDLKMEEAGQTFNTEPGAGTPVTITEYKIAGFAIKRIGSTPSK